MTLPAVARSLKTFPEINVSQHVLNKKPQACGGRQAHCLWLSEFVNRTKRISNKHSNIFIDICPDDLVRLTTDWIFVM